MAEFECPVVKLKIKEHKNADRLEIAIIEGYECVVAKDEFKTGDLAVYIPEQAIVPDDLIENLGLTGRLAGPDHNRVKAIKLRGVLSQGLICPLKFIPGGNKLKIGEDCTEKLEIVKYEPTIPAKLSGDVWNAGPERTIRYDIQNIKKYPQILEDEERVVITEKLHGTWCMIAQLAPCLWDENNARQGLVVASKGRADRGLGIKHPVPPRPLKVLEWLQLVCWKLLDKILSKIIRYRPGPKIVTYNQLDWKFKRLISAKNKVTDKIKNLRRIELGVNVDNVYWRVAKQLEIQDKILSLPDSLTYSYFVLGEVIGIQDLHYGANKNLDFRVFDIYKKSHEKPNAFTSRFLNDEELDSACKRMELERVPVLYRGPFSQEAVEKYTNGKETITGKELHVREGVVIRSQKERYDPSIGRVQLKSVSEKYLLRKGDTTDFN
jgi:RNA ligase (TIGR02306 family)